MSDTLEAFLRALALEQPSNRDLAVAALWWNGVSGQTEGMTVPQICRAIEAAGFPKQNGSRLRKQLTGDKRTKKVKKDRFSISVRAQSDLDESLSSFLTRRPIPMSDSVVPREIFTSTRNYVERTVAQINASFDAELYDCTAVMCRRLLETLIIEVYERQVRGDEIRGADGHFLMLNGLINKVENDAAVHLGREAMKGLKAFKKLGDQSAHNRRFIARRDDILRIRDGLRLAAEDLVHLAWPVGT